MIPAGKTLFEAFEMLDHFEAFEYMMQNTQHPLDENLLKEINRRVTCHTLSYRSPEAIPGEYTTTDMAAGDTVFGDHEELIARVPKLLESTEKAIVSAAVHPMILAARFHGFYEYLHPFRDGNGRTGRLISNYILFKIESSSPHHPIRSPPGIHFSPPHDSYGSYGRAPHPLLLQDGNTKNGRRAEAERG